jgi:hypothetical protein
VQQVPSPTPPQQLHHVPEDQQIRYAAFHLTGTGHLWFICSTKDAPKIEWALYNQCILYDFSPAPPRHTSTANDNANNFAKYVLQISIASEHRQINLFITGSRDTLQAAVAQHRPQEMMTAIVLAQSKEHLVPQTATPQEPSPTPTPTTSKQHSRKWTPHRTR